MHGLIEGNVLTNRDAKIDKSNLTPSISARVTLLLKVQLQQHTVCLLKRSLSLARTSLTLGTTPLASCKPTNF